MARYLITGATGLVGNNVARMLIARGDQVRVLVRGSSIDRSLVELPVEIAHGDVTAPETVTSAMKERDLIIHCAARVHLGWSQLKLMQEVNVEGTRNVARAARVAGIRMIHVSSVDALGLGTRANPATEETPPDNKSVQCPYVITKRAAEKALEAEIAAGLDAVIVNPVFMIGPWDWKPSSGRMLLEVARGKGIFAPPGGNDFVDVRDVAAGILTAVERGKTGRRYILGGRPMSYVEAWTILAKVTGARAPRRVCPSFILSTVGWFGDMAYRITGRESDVNSAAINIARMEHHFSYKRAAAELDYKPRPIEESATDAWNWFIEHGYAKRKGNVECRMQNAE